MLLETALADFSSDEGGVLGHQQQPRTFSREALGSKPAESPHRSECSRETYTASSPDIRVHHHQRHHREVPLPRNSSNPRGNNYSGELYAHSNLHHSGETLSTKKLHRQYSGDLLPHSQHRQRQQSRLAGISPAHLDVKGSPHGESRSAEFPSWDQLHRQKASSSSRSKLPSQEGASSIRSSKSSSQTEPDARYYLRAASNAADGNLLQGNKLDDQVVGTVPFERERQAGRRRSHSGAAAGYRASSRSNKRNGGVIGPRNQVPPARLVIIRESEQGECSNSSRSRSGSLSPERRRQPQYVRRQQQGKNSGSPSSVGGASTPQQHHMHLKVYPGDIIRISRMSSLQTSSSYSQEDSHYNVDIEVEKLYEDESHMSTLERLPSDRGVHYDDHLHEDGSSHRGSPADTHRGSAARPNSSASASPTTEHRISTDSSACSSSHEGFDDEPRALRCLQSFHSASLHSSAPPASNSSSSNFMASCLAALEVALHNGRHEENELGEEEEQDDYVVSDDGDDISGLHDDDDDGFLSIDGWDRHLDLRDARISTEFPAQVHHDGPEQRRRGSPSHRWTICNSQLEPEYHTMDFHSEAGDDRGTYRLSSAAASSSRFSADRVTAEAMSERESEVNRPRNRSRRHHRRHHSNDPPRSLDEYSWGDRRFLLDQGRMSSFTDEQAVDDMSSDCNLSMNRRQEVYWDDQQSDMNSERAEEVIRGAVDGLRFTYSPVSSAFVFTRPSDSSPFEDGELPLDNRVACFSPQNTFDTFGSEVSQRFSISLDYATSICSEDSLPHSVCRSSNVTELGLSRAESWSRIQRGASFTPAQPYPPGLVKHRGEYGAVVEDYSGEIYELAENDHLNIDHSDQLGPKRHAKRSKFPTCLAFRSILRNFKAFSPRRSRVGSPCPQCQLHDQQSPSSTWTPVHQTTQRAVRSH